MSTGSENTAQDLGDRLRATEGRFMMTAVADVESVAATGSTGKTISLSNRKTIFRQFFHIFQIQIFEYFRKSRFNLSLG